MVNLSWRTWLIWLLKANAVIWVFNALVLAIFVFSGSNLTGLIFSAYFSKITLVETGVVLVVAGAAAYSGSVLPNKAKEHIFKTGEEWSLERLRKGEKTANKFMAFAGILFLTSLIISLFGF